MADPVSIAKMREAALSRIVAEAGQIAAALDIPAPTITTYSHDRAYLEMARLTDVADWLGAVRARLAEVDAAFTASLELTPPNSLPLGVNAPDGASTGADNATQDSEPERQRAVRPGRNTSHGQRR